MSPICNIWPESTFLPELNEYLYFLYHKLRVRLIYLNFLILSCESYDVCIYDISIPIYVIMNMEFKIDQLLIDFNSFSKSIYEIK